MYNKVIDTTVSIIEKAANALRNTKVQPNAKEVHVFVGFIHGLARYVPMSLLEEYGYDELLGDCYVNNREHDKAARLDRIIARPYWHNFAPLDSVKEKSVTQFFENESSFPWLSMSHERNAPMGYFLTEAESTEYERLYFDLATFMWLHDKGIDLLRAYNPEGYNNAIPEIWVPVSVAVKNGWLPNNWKANHSFAMKE